MVLIISIDMKNFDETFQPLYFFFCFDFFFFDFDCELDCSSVFGNFKRFHNGSESEL